MLADVVSRLVCPHCRAPLTLDGAGVLCAAGHRFDVARQGYVNLLTPGAHTGTADTAAMVADRAAVHQWGAFAPVRTALADAAAACLGNGPDDDVPLVLDLGAGTGYYLAGALDACPTASGLAIDLSTYAARRAARVHPRASCVVADAWGRLPVADGAARLVLNVFAPRQAEEIARVLHADGVLCVVVPAPDHLAELVGPLGLLRVDDDKVAKVERSLAPALRLVAQREVRYRVDARHADLVRLVGMGPSAWHTQVDVVSRVVEAFPDRVAVTIAVTLLTFRPDRGGIDVVVLDC